MSSSRYFPIMSALLLAIVLVGFARTFYLHGLFAEPVLPPHLYLHGAILTLWFGIAFLQPYLVAKQQIAAHRRLGIVGIVVAVAVVGINLVTIALRDAPFVDADPGRGFANLSTVIGFAICVGSGVVMRNQPAAHKRLMLLASIQIVLPALDRLGRLPPITAAIQPLLGENDMTPEVAVALLGGVALLLTVVVNDIVSLRRLHPATLWSVVAILFIAPAISAGLIASGGWPTFVRLFV